MTAALLMLASLAADTATLTTTEEALQALWEAAESALPNSSNPELRARAARWYGADAPEVESDPVPADETTLDETSGLMVDAEGAPSLDDTIRALHASAYPDEHRADALDYVARQLNGPHPLGHLAAEAAFRAGEPDVGYRLILESAPPEAALYLIPSCVFGLFVGTQAQAVGAYPAGIADLPEMHLTVTLPVGRIRAHYVPDLGFSYDAPPGVPMQVHAPEGIAVTVRNESPTETPLTDAEQAALDAAGWSEQVGDSAGVWVDVAAQEFHLVRGTQKLWSVPCATATNGTGSTAGSNKTPLGWHAVSEKFGEDAPWGQVFRARARTHELWKPGMDTEEDLVLTRILWLDGLEPGKNRGHADDGTLVDSKQRYIYIHGTNGEHVIGTPSSHGCIRLLNNDVIEAFERIPLGAKVLITERS